MFEGEGDDDDDGDGAKKTELEKDVMKMYEGLTDKFFEMVRTRSTEIKGK